MNFSCVKENNNSGYYYLLILIRINNYYYLNVIQNLNSTKTFKDEKSGCKIIICLVDVISIVFHFLQKG
jgi:hypothetical protein